MPAEHVFRYDDFGAGSASAVEERFFDALSRHGLKATVAVVPAIPAPTWEPEGSIPVHPLTPERARALRQWVERGTVDVALHGYCHLATSLTRGFAEFAESVDRVQQARLLGWGRKRLEDLFGVNVGTFVPPWNSYSKGTLEALLETGFTILSASVRLVPAPSSLRLVPVTTTPDLTLRSVQAALRWDGRDPLVVTNVHDYDFEEAGFGGGRSWDWWEVLLTKLGQGPSLRHRLVGEFAARPLAEIGDERLAANAALRLGKARWSARLRRLPEHGVLWSRERVAGWLRDGDGG